jgi:hypothetical protein
MIALSLGTTSLLAQEPAPAERVNPMEVARSRMERGQALYQAGRFIESAEEFLRAYEAQPFAAFLFNAGVAYEKVDDPSRAADFFTRYLDADPQTTDKRDVTARIERLRGIARARDQQLAAQTAAEQAPDEQAAATARAELELARQRVADLEAQLAQARTQKGEAFKSMLSVQTKPEDATIVLKDQNGQQLARHTGSPFAQTLVEGRYTVEVEHPKYKTISAPLTVAAGKVYVVITEMSQGQFLGFLRVVTNVPGAAVRIDKYDEGALGQTPFQNPIATGKHHVWIEKPGYVPIERDVDIGVGDQVEVKADLERVDYGRVRVVASQSDARVQIDGKDVGSVPVELDLKAGLHEVRVSAPNMKVWQQTVSVARGQITPVRVRLLPSVSRAAAWVTAGVAAGFLGAGIATGIVGSHLEDDLRKAQSTSVLANNDGRMKRGKLLYIASDVSYGLTVSFALLATYYFIRDPLPDSEGRVLEPRDWAFAPTLSPEHAGANLHVRF